VTTEEEPRDAETILDETWHSAQVHSPKLMTQVVETVTAQMRTLRYPPQDVFAVWLCLEEAIVNALKHGHGRDPRRPVRVRYLVTPDQVVAVVADEGAGFDPARLPNPLAAENRGRPGGRGVFLMRMYMTSVVFNARGNEVTLCRVRSAADGSAGASPKA
jgi:serine/threonine-protein kinase RsbW